MTKRILFLLLFLSIAISRTNAQYVDLGLQGGFMNYQGDLTPDVIWSSVGESHSMVGAYIRYNMSPRLSIRLNAVKGAISGNDLNAASEGRRQRNLNFESPIYELALIGEINLFKYIPNSLYRSYTPYIFGGIAGFKFNPQTEHLERYVDLQPIGTEGQGLQGYEAPYELTQLSIPLGAGFKITLNEEWSLALELGARKTFTDYLDDVSTTYVNYNELSQGNGRLAALLADRRADYLGLDSPIIVESGTTRRGNPDNQDWYLMASISVSYHIIKKGIGGSSLKSSHFGCPKRF